MTGSIALQGLLLACLLIWAMRLLLRQGWFHGAKLVLCGGVVLTLGVALVCASRQRQQARAADQLLQRLPHEGRPGGYLSSDECRSAVDVHGA